jgi:hypothetical protein
MNRNALLQVAIQSMETVSTARMQSGEKIISVVYPMLNVAGRQSATAMVLLTEIDVFEKTAKDILKAAPRATRFKTTFRRVKGPFSR